MKEPKPETIVIVARRLYNAHAESLGWCHMPLFEDLAPEVHDFWVNLAYEIFDTFKTFAD